MRIKLKFDLPVSTAEGMTEGRVLEVLRMNVTGGRRSSGVRWWVRGDTGGEVGVLRDEADIVQEEQQEQKEPQS